MYLCTGAHLRTRTGIEVRMSHEVCMWSARKTRVLSSLSSPRISAPPTFGAPSLVCGCGKRQAEQWSVGLRWKHALAWSNRSRRSAAWLQPPPGPQPAPAAPPRPPPGKLWGPLDRRGGVTEVTEQWPEPSGCPSLRPHPGAARGALAVAPRPANAGH